MRTEDKSRRHKLIEIDIPLGIFLYNLSSLEAVTKYLKENLKMPYSEIARLLNRDDRTIWGTYRRSIRKYPLNFDMISKADFVPSTLFRNRNLGALEALTLYLREERALRYCQIAEILNRDDRTVWTAFKRAKVKTSAG